MSKLSKIFESFYKRHDLPQLPQDQVEPFLKSLSSSNISYVTELIPVGMLKPSQVEFNDEKVKKQVQRGIKELASNGYVVSKDNYIFDGHHRWKALLELDSSEQIKCYKVNVDIDELITLAHNFGSTFTKSIDEQNISIEDANKYAESIKSERRSQYSKVWKNLDLEQLRKGIEVEFEHTNSVKDFLGSLAVDPKSIAARIALDHLAEDPKYYDKLNEKYKDEYGRPSAAKRGYGHKWRKKREEIIERDKHKCKMCGKAIRGKGNKQVDHITNRNKKSGHDGSSNLRLLCGACHREKTAQHDRK